MCVRCLNLDGYAASRKIRSREQHGHRVTIVALTAEAMEGSREAGMDYCISKTVKRNGICEAPRKWLAPRGIEDASSGLLVAALVQAGAGDVPSS
jgi:CheY-like chemotaxis protein